MLLEDPLARSDKGWDFHVAQQTPVSPNELRYVQLLSAVQGYWGIVYVVQLERFRFANG